MNDWPRNRIYESIALNGGPEIYFPPNKLPHLLVHPPLQPSAPVTSAAEEAVNSADEGIFLLYGAVKIIIRGIIIVVIIYMYFITQNLFIVHNIFFNEVINVITT